MKTEQKLEKLEAVRGAAAIYVVFHHTVPRDIEWLGIKVGLLLSFGQEAIITFFLLSGFVITYSFQRSANKSFGHYFSNRFCRIYIPLFMAYVVTWFFASQNAGKPVNPELANLLGNVFMLQDFGSELPGSLFVPYLENGPLWSLSYEWWFYLLFFPLVTQISDKKTLHYTAFGIACVSATLYFFFPIFPLRVLMHFSIWWTGAYLAYLYLDNKHYKWSALTLPCLVLAFITTLQVLSTWLHFQSNGEFPGFLAHPIHELRHFSTSLFIVLAGIIWLRIGAPFYSWTLRPFIYIAPISYGIYIFHDPIMREANYLSFIGQPLLEWFIYFSIMLIIATLVEKGFYPRVKARLQPVIAHALKQPQLAS